MTKLENKFVENIPAELKQGVLYVSMEFGTVIHLCPCGCGERVVTPLTPGGWKLNYDGEGISLRPSIGNWSAECKSHYWIINNEIHMAERWTDYEIQAGRKSDASFLKRYFKRKKESKRKPKK